LSINNTKAYAQVKTKEQIAVVFHWRKMYVFKLYDPFPTATLRSPIKEENLLIFSR